MNCPPLTQLLNQTSNLELFKNFSSNFIRDEPTSAFFLFLLLFSQSKVMIVLFKSPTPSVQVHNEQHTIMWFSPFLFRLIARHQRKGKTFNKMVIFK